MKQSASWETNRSSGFWGRGQLEDLGVDGRIILQWIVKKCVGGMDWIYLADDTGR